MADKTWLERLPSTNFKIVIGAVLAIGTMVGLGVLQFFDRMPEEWALLMWLGFIASLWGINYMQFKTKRETQWHEDVPDVSEKKTTR